ncbi:hypothetical protein [Streptomyces hundungensis]|uniref:hypothetical protein n=1 Tax=Streptomyces hundungensis TaxID=1077946 RepID=UPI0033E4023E
MSDLDFYAGVAMRGDVLGAGVGTGAAGWEAKLGGDYVDNRSAGSFGRNYGILELVFVFQESENAWTCAGITVQTHRLLHGASDVPRNLEQTYGEFAQRVKFDDLRSLISRSGYSVEAEASATSDIRQYRVPESGARIFVVAEVDPYGGSGTDPDALDGEQVGDVWSINYSPSWWQATS